MEQNNYREQHYKRTEETIKLNRLVLRSLLGLLVVVLIGTGTAIVTATNSDNGGTLIHIRHVTIRYRIVLRRCRRLIFIYPQRSKEVLR